MDIQALLQPQSSADPFVITIKEVDVISAVQDPEPPQRSSLRQFIAEPVSRLRKRKLVLSFHRRTPSPTQDLATLEETSASKDHDVSPQGSTTPEDNSRPSKEQRRQTSTTEKIVGTLKKLLRKDSHHAEKALLPVRAIMNRTIDERRNNNRDKAILDRLAFEGVANLPNVNRYFDQPSSLAGPSNYYHTHDWMTFQANMEESNAAVRDHGAQAFRDRLFLHLGPATHHLLPHPNNYSPSIYHNERAGGPALRIRDTDTSHRAVHSHSNSRHSSDFDFDHTDSSSLEHFDLSEHVFLSYLNAAENTDFSTYSHALNQPPVQRPPSLRVLTGRPETDAPGRPLPLQPSPMADTPALCALHSMNHLANNELVSWHHPSDMHLYPAPLRFHNAHSSTNPRLRCHAPNGRAEPSAFPMVPAASCGDLRRYALFEGRERDERDVHPVSRRGGGGGVGGCRVK